MQVSDFPEQSGSIQNENMKCWFRVFCYTSEGCFLFVGISFVSVSDSPKAPENSVCHGKQNSDLDGDGNLNLWSVMANTPHGKIPGKYYKLFC